ncbi:HIT-like domain-containing protein [Mrakia frigida]|uniref:HIT-like domain-containing protein n=1 Tax=Mrakia frigida TaxID=29902 RepID=UPI003FCC0DB4
MSPPVDLYVEPNVISLTQARAFVFERILTDDPATRTLFLLGTIPNSKTGEQETAIVKLEKAAFDTHAEGEREAVQGLMGRIGKLESLGGNDIYYWAKAWMKEDRPADIKISVIQPATEVHISKHSKQAVHLIRETPELYQSIVLPYIQSIPASRTQWVRNILSGVSEADSVIYTSPSPLGFTVVPDLKWDKSTLSTLYLSIIAHDASILSLRSLRGDLHLPLLIEMRNKTEEVVRELYPSIEKGQLRFFVHYQPSYYHFHVHVVHVSYQGSLGMSVGQAHLLDDLIDLLQLNPSALSLLPLTYALGENHALWKPLSSAIAAASSL